MAHLEHGNAAHPAGLSEGVGDEPLAERVALLLSSPLPSSSSALWEEGSSVANVFERARFGSLFVNLPSGNSLQGPGSCEFLRSGATGLKQYVHS